MSKVKIFLLVFILHLIFIKPIFADEVFKADYNVTYTVSNNASTRVNFEVSLTNQTAQYYASRYDIQIGFKDLQNLKAYDPDGPLTPTVTKSEKGQNIELNFNKQVVGLNNKLTFNLSFETSELAQNTGIVWEINIPGISSQNDFSSFNVTVYYPEFLGRPVFIKPNVIPASAVSSNSLKFTKKELGASGISIAFGPYQIYKFNLTYHLGNRNLFPVSTEIALPPSTNYQEVLIDNITPRPKAVREDSDGNWLAEYNLLPSQNVKVLVQGTAKIFLNPKTEILSDKKLSEYLKEKPYWQTTNSRVKSLAEDLKTPRNIYNYVVDSLSYDFSRVTQNKPRQGAINIINEPASAVCLEFTDLFVTLARAAGIPAREVDGFANTKNTQERPLSLVKDVLHAWPQYYDSEKQTWIMVDPTWGNTTGGVDYFDVLDFDHFAFVIKGQDSSYPVPAGGYKLEKNRSEKDVDVSVSSVFNKNQSFKTFIDIPESALPGFPVIGNIKIENTGNAVLENQDININSSLLSAETRSIHIEKVLPFASVDVPIKFRRTSFLTNDTDMVKIQVGNKIYYRKILISPFLKDSKFILGGVFFVAFITLSVVIARSGRLHFPRPRG